MIQRALSGLRPRQEAVWLLRASMTACAALALALVIIARASAPNPTAATRLIGQPAPHFTLEGAQGGSAMVQPVSFVGAQGHPELLVFFNTLCVRCLGEITAARDASASATGGPVEILYLDTPAENAQITGAYMGRLGLDPPVALDTGGAVAAAYGAGYGPTLALVDRAGIVRAVWIGEISAAVLTAGITAALRESSR